MQVDTWVCVNCALNLDKRSGPHLEEICQKYHRKNELTNGDMLGW